jgi:chromosome segregation ATPase
MSKKKTKEIDYAKIDEQGILQLRFIEDCKRIDQLMFMIIRINTEMSKINKSEDLTKFEVLLAEKEHYLKEKKELTDRRASDNQQIIRLGSFYRETSAKIVQIKNQIANLNEQLAHLEPNEITQVQDQIANFNIVLCKLYKKFL